MEGYFCIFVIGLRSETSWPQKPPCERRQPHAVSVIDRGRQSSEGETEKCSLFRKKNIDGNHLKSYY